MEALTKQYSKIAEIEVGKTLNIGDLSVVDRNSWLTAVSRYWYSESHDKLKDFIKDLESRTLLQITKATEAKNGAELSAIKTMIASSLMGLGNLSESYPEFKDFQKDVSAIQGRLGEVIGKLNALIPTLPTPTLPTPTISVAGEQVTTIPVIKEEAHVKK